MKPSRSTRTESKRKISGNFLHVHCGLHDSWVEQANEWHQIIILLASECVASLTWCASDAGADEKAADLKSSEAAGTQQRCNLVGQHVLFIEKHTPSTLCFEAPSPILSLRLSDEFLAELAPESAWRGVLAKQWLELLKVDARINIFFDCARELCQDKAAQTCRKAVTTPCDKTSVSPHYIHALGLILAVHLLSASCPQNPGEQNSGLSPEQLQKVQVYIDAHFKAPFRITALYRLVGLDKNHFGKRFKNSTGMLPRRYILSRRVAYAQELLRAGQMRSAEVAYEAGFADQSHMRHCFRLLCNVEPPRRQRPTHLLLAHSKSPLPPHN